MKDFKKIKLKDDVLPNDKCEGYIIEAPEKVCRSIIDSLKGKGKKIAVVGGDNHFNRRAIETLKIDYLVSPERGQKVDTLKQRDSGLNHVLAKEASKRKVTIIIDLDEVSKLKGMEKARRISRIIQNVKICRRAKCKLEVISFGNRFDSKQIKAFEHSIGV